MLSNQPSRLSPEVTRGLSRQARKLLGNEPAWWVLKELVFRYLDAVEEHLDKLRELAQLYDLPVGVVDELASANLDVGEGDKDFYLKANRRMNSFVEINPKLDYSRVSSLHPLVVAEAIFRWLNPEFAQPDWDPNQGPSL